MRSSLSFPAKRELLIQTANRYQTASHLQKSIILDEFVAATGYAREYALRLPTHPVPPGPGNTPPIKRRRERRYGPPIQEALAIAGRAANGIGARRLVPFLAQLVPGLERHGHLTLTDDERAKLLAISPATADRILERMRQGERPKRVGTTPRIAVVTGFSIDDLAHDQRGKKHARGPSGSEGHRSA